MTYKFLDIIVVGSNISGLYFQLNDKVYLPGESINILEIGQQPPSRFDSGSTLICMTANINTACCRNSDGASVGSWYYPNRTEVPRPSNNYYSHFYRIGHTHQVRLTRQNNVLGPLGRYTCSVPDPQGRIWSATIIITSMVFILYYKAHLTYSKVEVILLVSWPPFMLGVYHNFAQKAVVTLSNSNPEKDTNYTVTMILTIAFLLGTNILPSNLIKILK